MYCWNSCPKVWAISVIFKKLPKVNTSPIGENSPNLATLALSIIGFLWLVLHTHVQRYRQTALYFVCLHKRVAVRMNSKVHATQTLRRYLCMHICMQICMYAHIQGMYTYMYVGSQKCRTWNHHRLIAATQQRSWDFSSSYIWASSSPLFPDTNCLFKMKTTTRASILKFIDKNFKI
jgi:hypothetical protein